MLNINVSETVIISLGLPLLSHYFVTNKENLQSRRGYLSIEGKIVGLFNRVLK